MKQYYEALFLSYRPRAAVFHNFEIQIALIQYSGRSKHAWANLVENPGNEVARGILAKPLNEFPKSPIRPAGCELWSV